MGVVAWIIGVVFAWLCLVALVLIGRDKGVKEEYVVSMDRPGLADLPELVRCQTPEAAAEVVRALLACKDQSIARVVVTISRSARVD